MSSCYDGAVIVLHMPITPPETRLLITPSPGHTYPLTHLLYPTMDAYPLTSLALYPSLRSFVSPTSRAMPYPPTSAAIYPRQPHRALLIHDVLDLIVEVVRHDPMTLKRWALVDKRWHLLVRPRLFRKVVINSDEHLFDVLDAFGRLDWLPRAVRELSLGQGSKISRRAQESCDARHLRRLKSVHTLGWYAMDWDALATRPENRDAMLALFARVHTLTLYNVVRSTDQFLEFVGCFPALARLQVGGISTWATGARHYTGSGLRPANVPRVLPRPRPATLCLDWDMFIDPKLWTGLRSVVDFSGLTELQAGNCAKQVTDLMGYLGDECRESLETLDLNVDFNYLSHCTSLDATSAGVIRLMLYQGPSWDSTSQSAQPRACAICAFNRTSSPCRSPRARRLRASSRPPARNPWSAWTTRSTLLRTTTSRAATGRRSRRRSKRGSRAAALAARRCACPLP
jgi:hypothetical protein